MRYLLLLIVSLMPTLTMAQSEQQIIEQINASSAKVQSLECDFVQTKHLKMLNNSYVSSGKLYYSQPDMLRWEYTTPYSYIFIMNRDKVILKNQSRQDVIDVNRNKIFKDISRLMMESIKGELLNDNTLFERSIVAVKGGYIATLIPTQREMKQMWSKILLYFDAESFSVEKIEMYEKGGDSTSIELKGVKLNGAIESSIFNIQ